MRGLEKDKGSQSKVSTVGFVIVPHQPGHFPPVWVVASSIRMQDCPAGVLRQAGSQDPLQLSCNEASAISDSVFSFTNRLVLIRTPVAGRGGLGPAASFIPQL